MEKTFKLQSKYVKYGKLSLLIAETKRDKSFLKNSIYLIVLENSFGVYQQAFFAILLAHDENPQSDIVISGIGMSEVFILQK